MSTYAISVSRRRVIRGLAMVTLALLLAHAGLMLWHHRVAPLPGLLLSLFDLDQEHSLPTWYSALLLGLIAGGCGLLAARPVTGDLRASRYWRVLAWGFVGLCLDEVAGLHEAVNMVAPTSWAWLAAPAVLAIGLAFLPFLRALPRRVALPLLVAGGLYVYGAIGVELLGDALVERGLEGSLFYAMTVLFEEGCEMAGALLCLDTVLLEIASGDATPEIHVGT